LNELKRKAEEVAAEENERETAEIRKKLVCMMPYKSRIGIKRMKTYSGRMSVSR